MTSSDQNNRDPRRDEVIAGEYVLGVLSAEDRRKVEDRLRSDRAFAAMVNRWEENLSAINQELETVTPPARVYAAVEHQLFDSSTGDAGMSVSGTIWTSLVFWRSAAFASLAAVATFLIAWSGILTPSPAKRLVAELSGKDSPIALVAHYDEANGMLSLTPTATAQDGAKSLELWLVQEGRPPVSLGVLPQSGEGSLSIPSAMRSRLARDALLAVSVEPPGGSPTGAATGPIIASGKAQPFR
ncbi:anti-sigma-K factor RskA [Mycoplana sp. BE70]|uniref:anti-sigma factor n=1 Tax=Mycoplana sp. BE70 TaxID=2817775 RepID=UPI00285F337D|nr:anti-sigma factor [Mycoplana sp. BE70]MDR6755116.1 anti-sigma-K factor RskA [Mycoplana sp. BE70]